MARGIDISSKQVTVPHVIRVDGVTYPNTQHNHNVVYEYWEKEDEKILDKLTNFVIDFGE